LFAGWVALGNGFERPKADFANRHQHQVLAEMEWQFRIYLFNNTIFNFFN
jgi:hypothetical protein